MTGIVTSGSGRSAVLECLGAGGEFFEGAGPAFGETEDGFSDLWGCGPGCLRDREDPIHRSEIRERNVTRAAALLGAFDDDGELMALATVHPRFEPGLAWLPTLHVSRNHRRRGAASALWDASVALAREAGARSLYVSATPSGSAVDFYLGRGCRLADPVHPKLFADEPEDIHLVCPLDDWSGEDGTLR